METTEVVPILPKYLEFALDRIAKNQKFSEHTIHVDNGSRHGDGFMATMIRVTIKSRECRNDVTIDRELPLICKLLPDSIERRETFKSDVVFEREVYFYRTILPIFIKFLEEKNVANEFSIYPKCFAAIYESQLDENVIIMEDLKATGYELWPKTVPIDFETVSKVLTELGKFHAISLAMYDQRNEIFEEKFRVSELFFEMFKGNGVPESMVSGAIQQTIDLLDDKMEIQIMELVRDNYEIWIKELFGCDAAGRFSVLNHGDLWNNNMMFNLNDEHKQLRFVDFQLLRLASPVIDISYYLSTSTGSDIHKRYNELLTIYYDSMSTFLTKLGSDPQKLFTFNDLEDQFRRFGKYGLIFAPILIGVMVSESKDIIDMDSIKSDSEADGLVTLNERSKILLKNRMSSVIQMAIKWGWVQEK